MNMTIKRARELLGEKGNDWSDEQVQKCINTLRVLAETTIERFYEMSPEEREKIEKLP